MHSAQLEHSFKHRVMSFGGSADDQGGPGVDNRQVRAQGVHVAVEALTIELYSVADPASEKERVRLCEFFKLTF